MCPPDVNLSAEKTRVLPVNEIERVIGTQALAEARGEVVPGKEGLVDPHARWGIVIGLDAIKGLDRSRIQRIVRERQDGLYVSFEQLASRARLRSVDLEKIAQAGALDSLGYERREGIWASGSLGQDGGDSEEYQPMLDGFGLEYHLPELPPLDDFARINLDYESMGMSPKQHPFVLLRPEMNAQGVTPACRVTACENRARIRVGGIITHRQRPSSSGGVLFLSVEDETGSVNVTVTENTWRQFRQEVMAPAVIVDGYCENLYGTRSVRAFRIYPMNTELCVRSRDFR